MDKFSLITTSQSTNLRRVLYFEIPTESTFISSTPSKTQEEKFIFEPFLECVKKLTHPKSIFKKAFKKKKHPKHSKKEKYISTSFSEETNPLAESLSYSFFLARLIRLAAGKESTFGRGRWPGIPIPISILLFTASCSTISCLSSNLLNKLSPSSSANQLLPYDGPFRWDEKLFIFNFEKEPFKLNGYLSKLSPRIFDSCNDIDTIISYMDKMFILSPSSLSSKGILVELRKLSSEQSLPGNKLETKSVRFVTQSDKGARWPFPEDSSKDTKVTKGNY